jgi:hypothetical protein
MKIRARSILVLPVCATVVLALSAGQAVAAPILNQIMINPIQVCNDAGAGCAQVGFFEPETDKIWAQGGIDINFMATTQLNSTAFLAVNFQSGVDEHVDLFLAGNGLVGDPETTMIINMYFVDDLFDNGGGIFGLGCGAPIFAGFCGGETGVIIADEVFSFNAGAGRLDTIAHEIGHVVGLTHNGFGAAANDNFMRSGATRLVPTTINDIAPNGLNYDQMSQAQIDEVFSDPNNRFVKPIPEPGAVIQFAVGTLLVASRLRRRKA